MDSQTIDLTQFNPALAVIANLQSQVQTLTQQVATLQQQVTALQAVAPPPAVQT